MHDMLREGKHNMYMVFPLLFNIQMPMKIKKKKKTEVLLLSCLLYHSFLTTGNSKAPFSLLSFL